jgi:hypothetical protein
VPDLSNQVYTSLISDVDMAHGYLYCGDVGSVADVSDVYDASNFRVETSEVS